MRPLQNQRCVKDARRTDAEANERAVIEVGDREAECGQDRRRDAGDEEEDRPAQSALPREAGDERAETCAEGLHDQRG